ncbi:hypothetical protein IJ090_03025 [Candidatus Saccharibacteria bacterium]|nr:hypothetical protein [Candidatus Saccharibacteria bacterium]
MRRILLISGLMIIGVIGWGKNASAFTTEVSSQLDGMSSGVVYGGTTVGATLKVAVKDGGTTPNKTKVQYAWFLIRDGYGLDFTRTTHNANGNTYWNGWRTQAWPDYQNISLREILSENTYFWRDLAAHTTPTAGTGYKHAKFGLCEYYWEFTGGDEENGYGYFPYADSSNYWTTRGGNAVLAECHQSEMREADEIPLGTAAVSSGFSKTKTVSITVPDVKAGYKFCVAAGINFSDSGAVSANQYRWHISGASCATIAKKPNFQVWNGGMYAPEGVVTSTTNKTANAGNGSVGETSGRLFGSWAEYYVVADSKVAGFASGAGIGYGVNMNTVGAGASNNNYCQSARLTIGNFQCLTDGSAGEYGGQNIATSDYIDELKTKYRVGAEGVEYYEGDISLSKISGVSGTRVIRSGGTVYIGGDICVFGDPTDTGCTDSGSAENYLGLGADLNKTYNSAIDVPQVLIMAKNIVIDPNVTQIDAWLITEDGGTISTCGASATVGTSAECWKTLKVNGPVYTSKLNLTRTGGAWPGLWGDMGNPNEPASLYYGGGSREKNKAWRDLTCDGSVTPAEIFDLHPATMVWSFYQATTLSRAYVTSMKEYAPRY